MDAIFSLAYIGYVGISSLVAYPLLRWKKQEPKSFEGVIGLLIANALFLGLLPIAPLLMRKPPPLKEGMSAFEAENYRMYFEKGQIWLWQEP